MPPRWLSLLIVTFWLGTTGWLAYQDVWPLLSSGQAPPYAIDLEDEVQTRQAHIRWVVSYNGNPSLRAETWVEPNPADDTFALHSELYPLARFPAKEPDNGRLPFGGLVEIHKATSVYRVTRQGDLRAVRLDLSAVVGGLAPGEGSLTGEVHDGQFRPHVRASSPVFPGADFDGDLDPVPVPAHGSILSPMHPVNRITGLRPGQTWRLPLVDPVPTVISALVKKYLGDLAPSAGGGETVVTAHVLPQTEPLPGGKDAPLCWVIGYQGDDVTAKTWVQVDNGLVLRQEAERGGDHWVLQRELQNTPSFPNSVRERLPRNSRFASGVAEGGAKRSFAKSVPEREFGNEGCGADG